MSERQQRRLLPAPKESSMDHEPPKHEPLPSRRNKGAATTKISTACEACKKRKSRCSGPPAPCTICSAQDTECVIDESLDQRRKSSSYRAAAEGAIGYQQVLSALIQSIRFSELDDVQDLVIGIRSSSTPSDIAAILERNIQNLENRGVLWPVDINELRSAFRPLNVSSSSHESDSKTVAGEPFAVGESPSGAEPFVHQPKVSEEGSYRSGTRKRKQKQALADQVNIYKRWIALFGSEPDPEADSRLERHPGVHEDPATRATGLWRRTSSSNLSQTSSPVSEERSGTVSDRAGWHPALQISNRWVEETSELAIDLSEEEGFRLADITSVLEAQEAEGWVETLRSIPDTSGPVGANFPYLEVAYRLAFARYPLFTVQPIPSYEDSPLSRAITDYLFATRSILEQGVAPIEILGFDGIDVGLFFRDREPEDTYTVSGWASEIWRSFHDWDVYVRLAYCLSSTYMMRWLIVPTAKRYADVPDILKPVPIQRIKPHHIAIDLLPIPALREALVKDFRDFMTALPASGLSVNWTGTMEDAVTKDEELGGLRLTEAFEKHVIQLENWSIGESILSIFPELQGAIRIDKY